MASGTGGQSPTTIAHNLQGIDMPADKQDLIKHAEQKGADREILDTLKKMPERRYETIADVMKGVGQVE